MTEESGDPGQRGETGLAGVQGAQPLRASDCLRRFRDECTAENPENLTTTKKTHRIIESTNESW